MRWAVISFGFYDINPSGLFIAVRIKFIAASPMYNYLANDLFNSEETSWCFIARYEFLSFPIRSN